MKSLKNILRKFPKKRIDKYRFIEKQKDKFPVRHLYRILRVREAAFYIWQSGKTSQPNPQKRELAAAVKEISTFIGGATEHKGFPPS